jgi:hypothetical protein
LLAHRPGVPGRERRGRPGSRRRTVRGRRGHRGRRQQLGPAEHVRRVREALAVELLDGRAAPLETERLQGGAHIGRRPEPRVVDLRVAAAPGDAQEQGPGVEQRDLVALAEVAVGRDQTGDVADQHRQPRDPARLQPGPAESDGGLHARPHQPVQRGRPAAADLQHVAGAGLRRDAPRALGRRGDDAGLAGHLGHPHDRDSLGHEEDRVGDAPIQLAVGVRDGRHDGRSHRTAGVPADQLGEEGAFPVRLQRRRGQDQHVVVLRTVGGRGSGGTGGQAPGSPRRRVPAGNVVPTLRHRVVIGRSWRGTARSRTP